MTSSSFGKLILRQTQDEVLFTSLTLSQSKGEGRRAAGHANLR